MLKNRGSGFDTRWILKDFPFLTSKKYLYFFPSCSGGTISLHHSITPSLPVRHLETRGELPYEKARAGRWKI